MVITLSNIPKEYIDRMQNTLLKMKTNNNPRVELVEELEIDFSTIPEMIFVEIIALVMGAYRLHKHKLQTNEKET